MTTEQRVEELETRVARLEEQVLVAALAWSDVAEEVTGVSPPTSS